MNSKLTDALAAFQAGNPIAVFDREANTGTYTYKYASYASLLECLKPLAANGVCWFHRISNSVNDGKSYITVETTIRCGGDSATSTMSALQPPSPQACGSIITYFKRYNLTALTGVCSDFDDDGSAATGVTATVKATDGKRGEGGPAKSKAKVDDSAAIVKRAIQVSKTAKPERWPNVVQAARDRAVEGVMAWDDAIGIIGLLASRADTSDLRAMLHEGLLTIAGDVPAESSELFQKLKNSLVGEVANG